MKLESKDGSVTFSVRVLPRASRSEIIGEHDGALKVKLTSPPVEGAANEELIKILSKELGIAKAEVEIISGRSSKTKRIRIHGGNTTNIRAILKAKS